MSGPFTGDVLAWGIPRLRDLPWRATRDPWAVLVSEVMLQQTQAARVVPRWHSFLDRFPTVEVCAAAPLSDVLREWQGLGYPRRARNLHMAARRVAELGDFPRDLDGLLALPGVGRYTARAVMAFAFVCGWRVQSEILPLEWRNVDRKAHTVRLDVGTTKNGRGRHIDYSSHPDLVTLFESQWLEHEALQKAGTISRYVFHRRGKLIKDFRGAWKAACTAAGLPGRRPHDLRRSAVRNLVRSGVPDTVAMKITGHRTRSVFDRYDITAEADLRDALGKLAGKEKGKSADSGRVVEIASR